jgi:hypothetical protein
MVWLPLSWNLLVMTEFRPGIYALANPERMPKPTDPSTAGGCSLAVTPTVTASRLAAGGSQAPRRSGML